MHMGHLPVRDIHLLIIPQSQRERDSVTSCEDSGDVGLHHLQGEAEVCIGGVCTLHEQTGNCSRAAMVPRNTWATSAQLWDSQVGFDLAFFTFRADHAGRDLQHPSASGLRGRDIDWCP